MEEWWKPKMIKQVKIEKTDPVNVQCVKCGYFMPRIWADKIEENWICHECQKEETKCKDCGKDHHKEGISECWKLPERELTKEEIEEIHNGGRPLTGEKNAKSK